MPEGWAWCRLGNTVKDIADIDHKMPEIKEEGIPFISPIDFTKDGKIDFQNAKKISKSDFERLSQKIKPSVNDIIFPRYGTIGVLRLVNSDLDFLVSYSCATIVTDKVYSNPKYIYYALQTSLAQSEINKYKVTTTQSNIGIKSLKQFFIPLAPLAEQQCIVSSIESIFAQIDMLEQNKSNLETAIKQAKSKILDLAIHGKLVPQDPNDEPAVEVLKRIATSDNRPYEKVDSSEIDWKLPKNWTLCHFGDIATIINGKNQSKVENPDGKYPIYGSGGIMGRADDYICPENCTIIGRKGSINNPIFVEEKFWNVDTAFGLCPSEAVLPKFLFYFCEYFDFTTLDSSTTLPSLTKTNIQQIIFALPPIEEQERILDKTDELFDSLDEIVLNLV